MKTWMTKITKHVKLIFDFAIHFIPIKNNQAMFTSFGGQYNDNPKYISERLHELYPDTKIIWVVSSKCHELEYMPEYIQTVKYGSFKSVYLKNRSKVLVDNSVGWYIMRIKNRWLNRWLRSHTKRCSQINISTYHGTIWKKGGRDYDDGGGILDPKECFTTSDVVIAGNSYNADRIKYCYFDNLPILLTGMPRNDILFNQSIDIKNLRRKLHLPSNENLVLYAPSWRQNVEDAGIKQMEMMDIDKLLVSLSEKFGGKWKMVFRAHNIVLEKMDKRIFLSEHILDGNIGDDMAEYIKACDVIISDFSGCLFDIALTDKPCFFFAHDVENYINHERGVYFDLKKLPYPVSKNFDELLFNIHLYDHACDISKRNELLTQLGNVEKGTATDKIVSIIHDFMIGRASKRDIIENNQELLFKSFKGDLT